MTTLADVTFDEHYRIKRLRLPECTRELPENIPSGVQLYAEVRHKDKNSDAVVITDKADGSGKVYAELPLKRRVGWMYGYHADWSGIIKIDVITGKIMPRGQEITDLFEWDFVENRRRDLDIGGMKFGPWYSFN